MAKFNFFEILTAGAKYGAAILETLDEVDKALKDDRLTAEEALYIIKTALEGADIKGLDAELIEIHSRPDGGFTVDFPHEAIKDWTLDLDL